MKRALGVVCLAVIGSILSGGAYAKSGIWVDDVTITNSGAAVFSDNFDDGNISDWSPLTDATLSSSFSHSPSKSLYLNWHGGTVADAFHRISIAQPSVVDYSVWVYLPPISEQGRFSFTNLYLYSGNTSDNLFTGVKASANESSYRLWLKWNGGSSNNAETSAVLAANTWAQLTLRMDNTTGTAYTLLNGQQQASISYDPTHFKSFNNASVWGWLGDGVPPVPEPSSVVSLLMGLGGVGGMLWRRRK